ncbi:putative ketoamine kinase [Usitatibacter rugosus]|uniref:Putative ketoamine kinase n=1 Tax=Usitatibacter rugosus TaxID=2732067 RepID=A0A6M4GQ81_9PROT|nr:fructosamine kinase family protein [Usitatibacter rugosus]QJR09215.1 putative ketoamine kinase [Usitatibacter rugosus]
MDPIAAAVARSIGDATGASHAAFSLEPVGGGCIHRAFKLTTDAADGKHSWFVKANDAGKAPMFEAEARGLASLTRAGVIRVPGVITGPVIGDDDSRDGDEAPAWLVLEWLDLMPLDGPSGARLGEALAAQHRRPQPKFGWARDNFIGSSPQSNVLADDWLDFWRTHRLQMQFRYAAHNRLPSRMISRGERLLADAEILFRNYSPEKSLLHGDLWSGNTSALEDGTPVVFDPAVYVGDREADLAMTELFGGFPKDFHSAYRNAWPLSDDYPVRRDFYNVYHVLNHANLFGGSYIGQAEKLIEKVLAEF